jgi:putative glutamine amidotransferase
MTGRLKIGVSQRRVFLADRNEERDAIDIRLIGLLWDLGFLPIPLISGIIDHREYLDDLSLDGFVLSGGNDIGECEDRDELEIEILKFSTKLNLPVLGICRGMQLINQFQKGKLRKVENHTAVCHKVSGLLFNGANETVNSFHDYGILEDILGNDLDVLAAADDGVIEALEHSEYHWLGIMWHPERNTKASEIDKKIIFNHLNKGSS